MFKYIMLILGILVIHYVFTGFQYIMIVYDPFEDYPFLLVLFGIKSKWGDNDNKLTVYNKLLFLINIVFPYIITIMLIVKGLTFLFKNIYKIKYVYFGIRDWINEFIYDIKNFNNKD